MLGAETFVSSILKVVTTVAILAAVYFLIIRPVLDTTELITHSISHSVNAGMHSANKALNQADISSPKVRRTVHTDVRKAIRTSGNVDASNLPRQAKKLLACVQKAGANIGKLQVCQS